MAKASDTSVIGDIVGFDILPGSDDVYNSKTGKWDKLASGPNHAPNCAYLGWGVYVMARVAGDERKHKAAWSAAAHLGGKDLSLWTVMYPSGFQVHRTSHSNIDEWVAAGYDKNYITSYLNSQFGSYNHPNRAVEPRIPGIFQYYSIAEDELTKIFAGQYDAQTGANNIAAAWEKLTDQIGREKQIALYKASLGSVGCLPQMPRLAPLAAPAGGLPSTSPQSAILMQDSSSVADEPASQARHRSASLLSRKNAGQALVALASLGSLARCSSSRFCTQAEPSRRGSPTGARSSMPICSGPPRLASGKS